MAEHTPTPWDIIAGDDYYITADGYPKEFIGHFKGDDNGGYLAIVGNRPKDFGEANAAFIVKAVNNHDALVNALRNARNYIDSVIVNTPDKKKRRNFGECLRIIEAALEPVGGPNFDAPQPRADVGSETERGK